MNIKYCFARLVKRERRLNTWVYDTLIYDDCQFDTKRECVEFIKDWIKSDKANELLRDKGLEYTIIEKYEATK
jgi:hypothetical protein